MPGAFDPTPILGPGGAIARRMTGYESRPEQLAMAHAVAKAIEDGGHLMVEAGTGVGKSFAYLVPAILAASEAGKKVVVSTHTISLQEQLLQKDLPFLRSVMPQEFTAALVKGRSNYVSLRRMDVAANRLPGLLSRPEEFDQFAEVRLWTGRTDDGSRSDLDFRPAPAVWDAVASENGNCLGKNCGRYKDCFYFKARRRMRSANLLIVNHALFLSDLALRASGAAILPDYDLAIFDEAHTLEAVAGDHLGLRLSSAQVDYLLNRLYNDRTRKGLLALYGDGDAMQQVQRVRFAARDFFQDVADWQARHGTANGRMRQPVDWPNVVGEELRKLGTAIAGLSEDVERDDQRIELTAMEDRCLVLASELDSWLAQSTDGNVYWIEVAESPRRKVSLVSAPLDVGPTLRAALFNRVPTCILASATLCVGAPPRFDFYKDRLGLTRCETLQLGSPFDYASQVTVHLPRNLPDPSDESAAFEREAIRAIPHYLEKTGGKAFVLFTSHRMLETAARELTPWLSRRNIALFAQSDGLPRSKMVEAFKADVNSVIFGADSFWQGVDVPGEALSNVIIVRL
ncbi:MAG: DEAD/DEAH box helicase, partial [Thermoleophilia bacterium]|nr:DEAD/DEAH box helicase [Thermoleophilia bacterium]